MILEKRNIIFLCFESHDKKTKVLVSRQFAFQSAKLFTRNYNCSDPTYLL